MKSTMESRPTLVEEVAVEGLPPVTPPTDPAAALSAEVERVREHGDPLDPIKSLAFGNVALRAIIPTALAVEVAEATPGWPIRFVAGGIALACALGYENARSAWLDRRRAKQRIREDARNTADETGQFVEFYRTGKLFKRDVTLMWYGAPKTAEHPQTGAAGMMRTVDLARQAGVKRIAAPESAVRPWIAEDAKPYGSYRRWLLVHKQRLVTGKAAKEKIYEASPDGWADLLNSSSALEGLIQLLGTVYPGHPIVTNAAFLANAPPALRKQKLLSVAQDAVDRRLVDIEGLRVNRHDPQAPQHPHKRLAAFVTGSYANDGKIQRFINGSPDTITSIATELHLSDDYIKQVLRDPRVDSARAPQIIELAILRLLKDKQQPGVPVQKTGEATADDTLPELIPLQARMLRLNKRSKEHRRPQLLGHRLGRLALAGALVAGVGFGINAAQTAGANYEVAASATAYQQVAHRLGVPESSGEITEAEVFAQMYADHPWLRYWDDTNRYASDVGYFLVNPPGKQICFGPCTDTQSQQLDDQGNALLGNASDGLPNHVDWTLEPHGMSAAGDWAEVTQDRLAGKQSGINSGNPDIYWYGTLANTSDITRLPDTLDTHKHPAYIAVSRHLTANDFFIGESENSNCTGKDCQAVNTGPIPPMFDYYYIPVREDSSLVAARYIDHGKNVPVQVLPQADGTYNIALPAQDPTGTLTYWLVPSHHRVHAVHPNKYVGPLPFDRTAFNNDIARYLDPDFKHQTPAQRAAIVAAAIGSNFLYAIDPIAPNEMRGVHNLAGYERQILLHRVANCNEANNIVALVDSSLNPVTGYSDDGSPAQQHGLYSHSLHMFDTDPSGTVYDGTPSNLPLPQAGYFAPTGLTAPKPEPLMPLPWLLGDMVLLAGSVGLWQRRRIARGVNGIRNAYGDRLQRQLVAQGATALSNTIELVERGIYGPGLDIASSLRRTEARQQAADAALGQLGPEQAAAEQARLRTAEATAAAAKLVSRPDLHTPHVGRMLKQAQPTSNGHRQTLDESRQIVRKSRLARRILPRPRTPDHVRRKPVRK